MGSSMTDRSTKANLPSNGREELHFDLLVTVERSQLMTTGSHCSGVLPLTGQTAKAKLLDTQRRARNIPCREGAELSTPKAIRTPTASETSCPDLHPAINPLLSSGPNQNLFSPWLSDVATV
jgi:hypothetical protein